MLKNQRGITLVALVVTIVILIILATISISVALNGGIVDQAVKAKDDQAKAANEWHDQNQNLLVAVNELIYGRPATPPEA